MLDEFEKYYEALTLWRNADNEDAIVLTRNEVCVILDRINFYRDNLRV